MGGLSAYDIYTKFKAGSGSSLSTSGLAARELVQKHADLESRVNQLIQKMEGAWRGDAAGAAQSGAAPLARVLQQSQTELSTANSTLSQQSSVFSGAQNSVVPVDKNAPKSNFLNNMTPWHTDLDKKIDKYNADANTNTRIYNNYSKSSGDLGNTMPASYASVNSDSSNVGVVEPNQGGPGSGSWGGAPGAHGGSGGGSGVGSAGWRAPVVHAGPIPGSGPGGPGGWQGTGGNPGGWTGGAFPVPPAATTSQGAGDIPGAGGPRQGGWGSGGSAGSGSGSSGSQYGGGFVPGAGPGGLGGGVGGSGRMGGGSARSGVGSGGTADRRLGAGGSMSAGEEPGVGRTVGGRAGAVGGRGAAGQPGMGMGGAGRGGRGEEDGEHHAASYLVDDRANEIVGELPLTAPPVIGE